MAGIKQPSDKSYFILPDLGEGVHEAELVKWRVKPGDTVQEHQTLAEMETDKALVEVPSPWTGVVSELHGKEGEILNVGNKLVSYDIGSGRAKSAPPKVAAATKQAEPKPAVKSSSAEEREDAGTVVGKMSGDLTISDRFRRREPEHAAVSNGGKALATPAVRRIARELGVDINCVAGSGRGGRVTASDIESFAATPTKTAATKLARRIDIYEEVTRSPQSTPSKMNGSEGDGISERIAFRGVRRKIAEALDRSVKTAVHFTVVDEADVSALDAKRKEYSAVLGRKLSFLPFIMRAVCKALRTHPTINANVDDEKQEILLKSVINLGCAVDTEHGLMVPVLHNADRLSLVQLADAVGDLAGAARNRTIAREQLTGGTFTISNVGSYGGMFATPILNYPEVGILAAGRVYEKVLTRNGMFYAGKVLPLSMSCDHRVVDGAEGARFLNTVVKLLENATSLVD